MRYGEIDINYQSHGKDFFSITENTKSPKSWRELQCLIGTGLDTWLDKSVTDGFLGLLTEDHSALITGVPRKLMTSARPKWYQVARYRSEWKNMEMAYIQ